MIVISSSIIDGKNISFSDKEEALKAVIHIFNLAYHELKDNFPEENSPHFFNFKLNLVNATKEEIEKRLDAKVVLINQENETVH
jgi:hypothetical protein